jgi:hypothetical protein
MSGTMHGYYAGQDVLPTHGGFTSVAELDAYEAQRRLLFTDKLHLPPRVFAGARLLELGPDAGENSLVFARWGAQCTLSEPHLGAHPVIREYFDRFGLGDRLVALESHELETYPAPAADAERFDVVDAEGFVNAVQPPSAWIDKLPRLLRPDGFVVLFYNETFGCVLELVWKVVQARFRELTGSGSTEAAERLFSAKWSSIPHKRSIESWTMDVLENPFVRLRYFLDAKDLCRLMSDAGFRLYASWPRYDGGLDVYWFKHDRMPDELVEEQRDQIGRGRLSHMFGRKHFLADLEVVEEAELRALLDDVDALVDEFDSARAARVDRRLAAIASILGSGAVIGGAKGTGRSLATIDMLRRLLATLAEGSSDRIAAFCAEDQAFIESWGMPAHFAVFRKSA